MNLNLSLIFFFFLNANLLRKETELPHLILQFTHYVIACSVCM